MDAQEYIQWLYAIETAAEEVINSQSDFEAEEFYLEWFRATQEGQWQEEEAASANAWHGLTGE